MADNSELLVENEKGIPENSEEEETIPITEEKQEANEEVASAKTSCEDQRAAGWLQRQQAKNQTCASAASAAAAAAGAGSKRGHAYTAKEAKKKC